MLMNARIILGFLTYLLTLSTIHSNASAEVFELRTYTTHEGKLETLNTRFRDHTVQLFERHGIESIGYWVPTDGEKSENTLIYVVRHESRDAAKASWKAFLADPDWKKAAAESRKGGPILARPPESVFMETTDYSPSWHQHKSSPSSVFELRIYQAAEGKLEKLDARFRDHTIKLFDKHGIESVAYWHAIDPPMSADHLFYIVRHESREAAKANWPAFGKDPAWKKAAKESGVGKLAKKPDATYMKATDYSAIQ